MGDRPASPMDAYDSRPSDRGDMDRHSRSRSRSPKYERRSASRSRSPPRRYSPDRRPRNRSRSRSRSRSPSRSRDRRSSRRRSVSPRRHSRSPRYRRRSPARRENKEFHGTREAPEMSNILGVFGLSLRTREEDLEDEFRKFGAIEKVTIVYDHRTNRSRGFGFVYFQDQEDATRARDAMNGKDIDGRKIRVDYSVTHRPHTPTPGQYMGERRPNYYDRDRRFRDRRSRRSRSRSFDRRRRYYRSRSRSRSWSR
ncbi:transformer 2 beta [Rhizopus azygosporus]|uniref:Transformer 2 beta n=1 Tax=Rhizopus azygosporus TaxID=86630 RepID=A0A367JVH3_RHIAZ|nr:transformer 2 beta [Rhizopus azygosporus]